MLFKYSYERKIPLCRFADGMSRAPQRFQNRWQVPERRQILMSLQLEWFFCVGIVGWKQLQQIKININEANLVRLRSRRETHQYLMCFYIQIYCAEDDDDTKLFCIKNTLNHIYIAIVHFIFFLPYFM